MSTRSGTVSIHWEGRLLYGRFLVFGRTLIVDAGGRRKMAQLGQLAPPLRALRRHLRLHQYCRYPLRWRRRSRPEHSANLADKGMQKAATRRHRPARRDHRPVLISTRAKKCPQHLACQGLPE